MDKKRFGQFIKEARVAQGLTQAEVAERLFVDVTAVSKWERGVNFPDISMISDICKTLGVTEHELIESSKDTEYREMIYNSKRYLSSKKALLWTYIGLYLTAILTCFIVNLCVSHTLSWFYIVLTSLATGFWGTTFPIWFKKIKKRTEDELSAILSRLSLLIYAAGLFVFTMLIYVSVNAYAPFDLWFAVKVTLFSFLILFAYGAVHAFRCSALLKASADLLLTDVFLWRLSVVLPALMGVEAVDYFDVNFADWAGHSNGNVALIILLTLTGLALFFLILGIFRPKKAK